MSARKVLLIAGTLVLLLLVFTGGTSGLASPSSPFDCNQAPLTGWEDGKFQTHPRGFVDDVPMLHNIDIGHLGPDVDVIVAIDVPGVVPFGGRKVFEGTNPTETRFVMIVRTDIDYVQFKNVLGGDEFHLYQISEHGGDEELARQAYCHAVNTARLHQVVYDVQDWGAFLREFGQNEPALIEKIVLCQEPEMPGIGIPSCDFVTGP